MNLTYLIRSLYRSIASPLRLVESSLKALPFIIQILIFFAGWICFNEGFHFVLSLNFDLGYFGLFLIQNFCH